MSLERRSSLAALPNQRGNCEWWKYTWPLHKDRYGGPKILCPYLASDNRFAIDADNEFLSLTDTTVLFPREHSEDFEYFLGLLNSELLEFRFRSIGKLKAGGIIEYFWNSLSKLPIKRIDMRNRSQRALHDEISHAASSLSESEAQLQNVLTDKGPELLLKEIIRSNASAKRCGLSSVRRR